MNESIEGCVLKMSVFTQFIKSLYSPKDIARFRFQGIGKTILFVFILSLVSLLPVGISMSTDLSTGVNSLDAALKDSSLPSFIIEDGTLNTTSEEPFVSDQGHFVVIVDGTGTIKRTDVVNYQNAVAFLESEVVLSSHYQNESIPYTTFEGLTLSDEDISTFIETMKSTLPIIVPILLIIMYIFTSAIKFIEVSVLGLVGLLLRNIMRLNLRYRHTWILAAYCMTIPTVFFTIMDTLHVHVPYAGTLNWFVATFILYLTYKEIPKRTS